MQAAGKLPTYQKEDEVWSNHAYLALDHLVRLHTSEDFIKDVSCSKEVGGKLDKAKYGTREFYDKMLYYSDMCEVSKLKEELKSTPFPEALVIAADAKENVNGIRIYFYGPPDPEGGYQVMQRLSGF